MSGRADLYNWQLHRDKDPKKDERKRLDALEEGKSPEETQRYEDAACYRIQCAAGLSSDNPNYQAKWDSQQRGAGYLKEQGDLWS
ncbi:hypothetical protein D7S89_21740 [Trinickia fusca]|uniref:Uncharacterized protein n=1 Tax=Trinickia fusca TaxID=2419777 RepID=A0A494X3N9_9BURK|nr:hypothetical protein D7S89_21740 [Trinickia fusca]